MCQEAPWCVLLASHLKLFCRTVPRSTLQHPVQAKQNIPKCPGMPEAEAAAPKLSKTARKNAKRKEQRQAAAEGTGGDSSGGAADGTAEQLQHMRWGTLACSDHLRP